MTGDQEALRSYKKTYILFIAISAPKKLFLENLIFIPKILNFCYFSFFLEHLEHCVPLACKEYFRRSGV